jgi:hypothetical protein
MKFRGIVEADRSPAVVIVRSKARSSVLPSYSTGRASPCESFRDGVEAGFWKDAKESVNQCRRLLAYDPLVAAIKANGHQRYLKSERQNESVLKTILNHEALLNRENERPAVVCVEA